MLTTAPRGCGDPCLEVTELVTRAVDAYMQCSCCETWDCKWQGGFTVQPNTVNLSKAIHGWFTWRLGVIRGWIITLTFRAQSFRWEKVEPVRLLLVWVNQMWLCYHAHWGKVMATERATFQASWVAFQWPLSRPWNEYVIGWPRVSGQQNLMSHPHLSELISFCCGSLSHVGHVSPQSLLSAGEMAPPLRSAAQSWQRRWRQMLLSIFPWSLKNWCQVLFILDYSAGCRRWNDEGQGHWCHPSIHWSNFQVESLPNAFCPFVSWFSAWYD